LKTALKVLVTEEKRMSKKDGLNDLDTLLEELEGIDNPRKGSFRASSASSVVIPAPSSDRPSEKKKANWGINHFKFKFSIFIR
jgi:hypothetical protein